MGGKIKNWLIKKLGGITLAEQESVRVEYEAWAVRNLTGKNGEVTPDCLLYLPYYNDDIVVIRSNINICNGEIKGLSVAPWCRNVFTRDLRVV
ncbi:hypothetical protein Barba22A_gp026 [Rheinheimera phage vB_RspM_Barba22A]|jgi:hypothetical protein|uniref:Uncharacterized protein n=79 Tax=Barbavirus TaxID=2733095 RepID=A0A7G9VS53_9CAUD|nr:hypothetical protein HOV44_gp028 [Rheinheimera phage Barba5S]YP_009822764.1 hypothetical protein HOV45_gp028 [Rheinheimera phage Barba8S]YP_009822903.1 hypothetical protein HOV46_gp026 [Rheinheimera phage vB_RspM_Barba18A]YP_009823182.1 hypothetical protein HOV48_gp026 [Rheinheimera phage Barba21A]QCQ57877.1 hypothetical protein Barba1A_gp026 [Rheinheimera phage vB_RspM_Barba1A]QCQ58013.1 hypothetical protein Barba1S_gp026 [Rheinheimera phage vB_RspM_Barba1S]QCQ58149.1 hypothetical protein